LSGEVDYVETDTPADVTFVLAQRPHAMFTRKGHDLAMELKLSLGEALCGFSRTIPHLDGTPLVLHSPRGAFQRNSSKRQEKPLRGDIIHNKERSPPIMICDGDVHVLKGKGMPKRRPGGDGIEFGDLYVQYKVEMPLTKENAAATAGKNKGGHLTMDERIQLKKLLDKLEGRKTSTAESSSVFKSPSAEEPCLEVASALDFGRASGPFVSDHDHEDDDHLQRDDEDGGHHSPFGPRAGRNFQYFSSGSSPGRGFHQHQHFFGQGSQDGEDDGSNVQCQQM
jgi:hypothetical protein